MNYGARQICQLTCKSSAICLALMLDAYCKQTCFEQSEVLIHFLQILCIEMRWVKLLPNVFIIPDGCCTGIVFQGGTVTVFYAAGRTLRLLLRKGVILSCCDEITRMFLF